MTRTSIRVDTPSDGSTRVRSRIDDEEPAATPLQGGGGGSSSGGSLTAQPQPKVQPLPVASGVALPWIAGAARITRQGQAVGWLRGAMWLLHEDHRDLWLSGDFELQPVVAAPCKDPQDFLLSQGQEPADHYVLFEELEVLSAALQPTPGASSKQLTLTDEKGRVAHLFHRLEGDMGETTAFLPVGFSDQGTLTAAPLNPAAPGPQQWTAMASAATPGGRVLRGTYSFGPVL